MVRTALIALAALGAPALAQEVDQGPPNVPEFRPAFEGQTRAPAMAPAYQLATETVASGLSHPWGIAVLPVGGYLVTERRGRLYYVSAAGDVSRPLSGLPDIRAERQGGLLDVKLDPDFAQNRLVYWTYSKPVRGGSVTAAARGRLASDFSGIEDAQDIFRQTPASRTPGHYGSRIVFGAGDVAYVTTGDRMTGAERAQDLTSTYGKVVRMRRDGAVFADNPFAEREGAQPEIWSLGHRNIQGALVHPQTGDLWTIEHGPKGGDELNRVARGANYGWPVITYGENYNGSPVGAALTQKAGLEQPVYYWDPVIAPGDMTVYDGDLFEAWKGDILIASLRPGGLVRLRLEGGRVVGEERMLGNLGRVRDVEVDADGSLLLLLDRDRGGVVRVTPAR